METKYDPLAHIQWEGATWKSLKLYLEDQRQKKIGLLIGAETHDRSNQIRGAIQVIDQLLALDKPGLNNPR